MMTEEVQKLKILIVDDDAFLLDMYAMKFTESGYEVLSAVSGENALELLRDNGGEVSFALIDLVMPEMDGFTLLEQANQEGLHQQTKFIVLSNLSQESDIERAKQLHAIDYIVKANYTPQEVVDRVRETISKHNGTA